MIEEVCDVSDLDAVRTWTADLSGRIDALHGLVHNAGAMPKERIETAQGHETQLACHVLGPQLMTEELLPLLTNAHGASVVFMSSGGMYTTPLSVDDLESIHGEYDGVRVYARTKRMQVVLADAVGAGASRAPTSASRACTRGGSKPPASPRLCRRSDVLTKPLLRDAADGADTAVWLVATRPESGGHISGTTGPSGQRRSAGSAPRIRRPVARFLDEVSRLTQHDRVD